APTRSDDQILPFAVWVQIRKSNHGIHCFCLGPAIYIQQFWNTLTYVEKARTYRFQLDENWFTLDANLLREALDITPIDQAHPFVTPPSGDAIMDLIQRSRLVSFTKQQSGPHAGETRDAPLSSSKQQSGPHAEQPVEDIPIPDSANISDSEDTDSAHLPKIKQMPEWLKHIPDNERPTTLEHSWFIPTSHIPDTVNNWANALATTREIPSLLKQILKAKHLKLLKLSTQTLFIFSSRWKSVTRCLSIRLTGLIQKVIKSGLILANLCLLVVYQALSISKMKDARYHDFGLELLVPEHMWINDVYTYDISASYGISHCVVRIKAYSRYGYDYMKEIALCRADYQEYTIAKKDFKNLYPSDFEYLNLQILQGHLNHLSGSDKRMLSTALPEQLNLTKPGWEATGYEYKYDYTIIESPRAVVFPVSNNERKILRFNEIYKFSDGALTNILEALDYRVKEYKVSRLNPGMNTRFWMVKDVERSKEFIHAIEQRLKTRRIFRNLECFVGGHVHDIDYRLLQRTK
ncbi:hypothetical protein Tco_1257008, partial [Tanacetum coccineum]